MRRQKLLSRPEQMTYRLEPVLGINPDYDKIITMCLTVNTKSEWVEGLNAFWELCPLTGSSMREFAAKIAALEGCVRVMKSVEREFWGWSNDRDIMATFYEACSGGSIMTIKLALEWIKKAQIPKPSFVVGFAHALYRGHLRAMIFLKEKCLLDVDVIEVVYHRVVRVFQHKSMLQSDPEKNLTKVSTKAKKLLRRWGCEL